MFDATLASLGGFDAGDVHLQSDAVDRHALRAKPLHQIVDAVRLLVQALAAVVVVEEQRLRIGLARDSERVGDVLIAELLPEHRIPQPRPIVGDRFVDDVPGDDAAAKVFGDRADVILERDAQIRRGQTSPTQDGTDPCQMSACPLIFMPLPWP